MTSALQRHEVRVQSGRLSKRNNNTVIWVHRVNASVTLHAANTRDVPHVIFLLSGRNQNRIVQNMF